VFQRHRNLLELHHVTLPPSDVIWKTVHGAKCTEMFLTCIPICIWYFRSI
jgi:hypothetical protein